MEVCPIYFSLQSLFFSYSINVLVGSICDNFYMNSNYEYQGDILSFKSLPFCLIVFVDVKWIELVES